MRLRFDLPPASFGGLASPTEHPLGNFVGALLHPLGSAHALLGLQLISVLSLASIVYFAFRLGQTLFNPAVGAVFALILFVAPTLNYQMAAIVVSVIPVVVAFFLAQRQFVAGIAAGAVKQ